MKTKISALNAALEGHITKESDQLGGSGKASLSSSPWDNPQIEGVRLTDF